MSAKPRVAPDQWTGLVLVGFFVFILVGAFDFPRASRLFPVLVASTGLVLLALFFLDALTSPRQDAKAHPPTRRSPAAVLRALTLVPVSITSFILLGFWITSVLFVLLTPRLLGWRARWSVLALVAVLFTTVVGVAFQQLLRVPVPKGIIIDALIEASYTD